MARRKSKRSTDTLNPILAIPVFLLAVLYSLLFLIFAFHFIFAYKFAYKQWLKYRFWQIHGKNGRFVLFVYSDSPNWKEYIETNILPRIERHAVVLNWSRRSEWDRTDPFAKQLFVQWTGTKEFNPIAIIFSPPGRVTFVRFWQAFRDLKHGKESSLKIAEDQLFKEVNRMAE